ncbi:MAG: sulfotransferase family 2 domain-containing protein [Wenzhouxiangellaceae bacterium]|nr:sulfotransferase family 2 domain-containing protein [Wenzhouxiangellaceae bacterium]
MWKASLCDSSCRLSRNTPPRTGPEYAMIISHAWKFIFLKTNKTAGTSVEIALSKFCGPDDIITPISQRDERLRRRLGYRGPQNFCARPGGGFLDRCAGVGLGPLKRPRFYNHMPAKKVRAYVGEQVWADYLKFCIERHPLDRLVSMYFWRYRNGKRPPFPEFLESREARKLKRKGIDVYTIDRQVAVDRICRFENLHDEMARIAEILGLPGDIEIPRAKNGFRKDNVRIHDLAGQEEIEQAARMFRDECRLLGYSVEPARPSSEEA